MILECIVGGSALILAVLLLRMALRERLPRMLMPLMWLMAALRLILPIRIASPLSVRSIVHSAEQAAGHATAVGTVLRAAIDRVEGTVTYAQGGGVQVIAVLWAAGALLLAVWLIVGYAVNMRRFARSRTYAETLYAGGISNRCVRVFRADHAAAPLTYGILRPVILLPRDLNGRAERLVTAHELMHVRRFDALTKLIIAVALVIHWFNPLAWVMAVLAARDIELACDESTLKSLETDTRKEYAHTLVCMESARSAAKLLFSGFGRNICEERVRAIMKNRKISTAAIVLAVLVLAGTVTAFAAQTDSSEPLPTAEVTTPAPQPEAASTPAPAEKSEPPAVITDTELEVMQNELQEIVEIRDEWIWPLEGEIRVTAAFGTNPLRPDSPLHEGLDCVSDTSDRIFAAKSGVVESVGFDSRNGNFIVIDHGDGYKTEYRHCAEIFADTDDIVEAGAVIASVGATGMATGPHCHFGVMENGEYVDPMSVLE